MEKREINENRPKQQNSHANQASADYHLGKRMRATKLVNDELT